MRQTLRDFGYDIRYDFSFDGFLHLGLSSVVKKTATVKTKTKTKTKTSKNCLKTVLRQDTVSRLNITALKTLVMSDVVLLIVCTACPAT